LSWNPTFLEVSEIRGDFDVVTSDGTPRTDTVGSEGSGVAEANETDTLTSQGGMRSSGVGSSSGGPISLLEEINQTLITARKSEEGLVHGDGTVKDKDDVEVVAAHGFFVVTNTVVPDTGVVLNAVAGRLLVVALGVEAARSTVSERSGAGYIK
jgi:hypothetical protein